jgi:hypothetical protein
MLEYVYVYVYRWNNVQCNVQCCTVYSTYRIAFVVVWVYGCMNICVYVCICVCEYVCMCVCVYVYVCMCVWVYRYMCIYVYIYVYICVYVCVCVCGSMVYDIAPDPWCPSESALCIYVYMGL